LCDLHHIVVDLGRWPTKLVARVARTSDTAPDWTGELELEHGASAGRFVWFTISGRAAEMFEMLESRGGVDCVGPMP